ncbi:MAG: hypothetical protein M3Y59_21665 [Myxococcota bacterium]|nr:hypothetical protein [Myxococcota bacterium]
MRRLVVLIALVAPVLVFAGDAKRGEIIYQRSCSSCHSAVGPVREKAKPTRDRVREKPVTTKTPDLVKRLKETSLTRFTTWLENPTSLNPHTVCDVGSVQTYERDDLTAFVVSRSRLARQSKVDRQGQKIQKAKYQKALDAANEKAGK